MFVQKSYKEIMDLLDCNKTTVWRTLKKYKEVAYVLRYR
ncbi:helix-turn-helix domain-containing protein [Streptococcus pneumoniae]|nr:helix-turn-helix domain-containing protein [Streptococcus pneumoniae]